MAKTKRAGGATPPRRLVEKLIEAHQLLENEKPDQALVILNELERTYPNSPEVLEALVDVYYDLRDYYHYEGAIQRLVHVEQRNPDLTLALAGAYMTNQRPALALRTFQEYLRRWPEHSQAPRIQEDISLLEEAVRENANELNMPFEDGFDLLIQHEEIRYYMEHGELRRGRQIAEKLLERFPDFVPALNNLGQIYAVEGEVEKAIQISERVLEIVPENVHALSNLARMHFLRGRADEASQYAKHLKQSGAKATDRWVKIAEALTYLEDDEDVLALYAQAGAADELEPPAVNEVFYHLLAVAACRLGKEKDARRYWEKALEINPNFTWARENLEDLGKPAGERSGPWAYPFDGWLLGRIAQGVSGAAKKLKRSTPRSEGQPIIARFLGENYPELFFLAPHLVERGDLETRNFVVNMAVASGHPALVEAAKGYVLGQRGSFQERFEASRTLAEGGLLPSGSVRMWREGEWREVLMLSMEISPEPVPSGLPKRAQALFEQAWEALNDGDGKRAQEILEKAVAEWPDDPSMRNNLAMAHQMQGHTEIAHQMGRETHARFPDYFFGIIGAASLATIEGDLEKAHGMLNGLMERKKLHTSEFSALCRAQIQVWLAERNKEAARAWLEMWEQIDPGNPDQTFFRFQIGGGLKDRLRLKK